MAVFAKLADDGKTVVNVVVVDEAKTTQNNEINEAVGQDYLHRIHGWPAALWKLAEVDRGVPYRKNSANIGHTYDSARDAFIAPQPFPSWSLNETTCRYDPPTPRPTFSTDENGLPTEAYEWDESAQAWVRV